MLNNGDIFLSFAKRNSQKIKYIYLSSTDYEEHLRQIIPEEDFKKLKNNCYYYFYQFLLSFYFPKNEYFF